MIEPPTCNRGASIPSSRNLMKLTFNHPQLELEVIKMVELGELKEVDGMLYPTVQTMEKMATAFDIDSDHCNCCSTTGELKHCTGCFAAKYCSINYQTKDWLSSHWKVCSMLSHLGVGLITSARKEMAKCKCCGTSCKTSANKVMPKCKCCGTSLNETPIKCECKH